MLVNRFPDITWLKEQIQQGFSNRQAVDGIALAHEGWPTVVLNTEARQAERRDIQGPFSLFINLRGTSTVGVEGREYQINQQCYSLSNAGQRYDLLIDNPLCTETLNIHFGEHFYAQSVKALSETDRQLLDNPFDYADSALNVAPRSLQRTARFDSLLQKLRQSYQIDYQSAQEEEALFEILREVMLTNHNETKRIARLPIKSQAVKQEITSRLFTARDYIHGHFSSELSLDALSRISCLSKFHFLRLFKQAFQQSPYQYQKSLRLNMALDLYKGGQTLEEVASKVGIENASSLSRMISRQYGRYPSQLVQ
jgi:AraC family transcriptional regulator